MNESTLKCRHSTLLLFLSLGILVTLGACGAQTDEEDVDGTAYHRPGGERSVGEHFSSRSPVIARNGVAATNQPLATQIALDIMQRGGNAVDAAVAANAALGVMEPAFNGIGGDMFAIIWDPETGQPYGLNASGRSPRDLTYEELQSAIKANDGEGEIPSRGPLPLTVPGTVDGWFAMHERFGELSMDEILAPAIEYAREGVPITKYVAHHWASYWSGLEEENWLPETHNYRETFLVDGGAPEEGDIFRNPDLAGTLETIAEGGREAFYEGPIAGTILDYMDRIGGHISAEDLADHSSTWVDLISTNYRAYEVYEIPPNTQGAATLQMLNILEGYDLSEMGHNSADYLHLMIEAKKLAFADRARYYADPAFADVPIDRLLAKDYAAERRKRISMDSIITQVPFGDAQLERGDTFYLTTADSIGLIVSLIHSNYYPTGSGLASDDPAFALQNRGALFSMEEGHPNVYEPGKRPFHTIIPAFATKDGEPFLSFGLMGGSLQPQTQVQTFSRIVDFGMNVQEAADAARWAHGGSPGPTGGRMSEGGSVTLEEGVPPSVVEELRSRGHTVDRTKETGGVFHAVRWDAERGVYYAASEMRWDGQAGGY
jgi:gamma-glutamyltranspeptidase/glutathione hydrolase